jgi:hypothetical protein
MCGGEQEHKRKRDRSGIGVELLRQRAELGFCSIGRRFSPLQDWHYERNLTLEWMRLGYTVERLSACTV